MTTEEKETLKHKLAGLKEKSGKYLDVFFGDYCDHRRKDEPAYRLTSGTKAALTLFEPLSDNDFQDWLTAIREASEKVDLAKALVEHKKLSPDFFESIKASIEDL
jgi:hypothetical protein